MDKDGEDERTFLTPIKTIIDSGLTQADIVRELYHAEWNEDINKVYTYYRY